MPSPVRPCISPLRDTQVFTAREGCTKYCHKYGNLMYKMMFNINNFLLNVDIGQVALKKKKCTAEQKKKKKKREEKRREEKRRRITNES
ncbi:hypothetical protein POVWA2_029630 [Plasmodium ovale wallikeri]|uniref:Uncharacterized protein n=1 Tax=Plasmodium ovale wallikeri TaxID=864142 RepID=A0A1A8YXS4_PLAOA|nr:hypothetical protein POVWA2_029630 [Plasmodium ovale wallikeri]